VIRDNDVVIYDFAFRRLGDGRHATQESSKNYDPLKQRIPLISKKFGACGRLSRWKSKGKIASRTRTAG
jgi:hypothetical protein